MKYYILASLGSLLPGCASLSPMENKVCDGFNTWIHTPLDSGEIRSVSFDWAPVGENSIPVYASMHVEEELTDYERTLYGEVAQATHHIDLDEYTGLVSSCLNLKRIVYSEEKRVYSGKKFGKEVRASWESGFCHSPTEGSASGCFRISITNKKA